MTRRGRYEKRAATEEGRLSLAAAKLALHVGDLLNSAKLSSRLSSKEIADRLGVTEGRVSQVLNGDGNLHVATIARFLGACGFEVRLDATPLPGAAAMSREEKRVRAGTSSSRTWHVFAQHYVNSSGVTKTVSLVEGQQEDPIPLGEPVHMGKIVSVERPLKVDFSDAVTTWQQRTRNAVDNEGNHRSKVLA